MGSGYFLRWENIPSYKLPWWNICDQSARRTRQAGVCRPYCQARHTNTCMGSRWFQWGRPPKARRRVTKCPFLPDRDHRRHRSHLRKSSWWRPRTHFYARRGPRPYGPNHHGPPARKRVASFALAGEFPGLQPYWKYLGAGAEETPPPPSKERRRPVGNCWAYVAADPSDSHPPLVLVHSATPAESYQTQGRGHRLLVKIEIFAYSLLNFLTSPK